MEQIFFLTSQLPEVKVKSGLQEDTAAAVEVGDVPATQTDALQLTSKTRLLVTVRLS